MADHSEWLLRLLHFPLVKFIVLLEGVASQVAHVVVNIDLILAKLIDLCPQSVNVCGTVRVPLSNFSLVHLEFSLDVPEKLFEMLRVIQDQPIYHSLVDFDRWKLVLVILIYDSSQLGEMLRYLGCTVVDDQREFVEHLDEELVVNVYVLEERLRFEDSFELITLFSFLLADQHVVLIKTRSRSYCTLLGD